MGPVEQGFKGDLFPVHSGTAGFSPFGLGSRDIADGIVSDAGDQMLSGPQKGQGDLAGSVERIGDHVKVIRNSQQGDQFNHLVQQGALVAVGEDDAFMDAGRQRDADDARQALDQDAYRLAGMPQDGFGFGVGFGGLLEAFDAGHLFAGFGDLNPVADQDATSVARQHSRMEVDQEHRPQTRKRVQIQRRGVEQIQEPVIADRLESQGAHETGDAPQVLPDAKSHQDHTHP